jgi:DNA-binding response OmpR family regulator
MDARVKPAHDDGEGKPSVSLDFGYNAVVTDRILLIEDDPSLAEMVKSYLGEAGFRVSIAGRGEAGIAMSAREPFDSIILDLMLPDMDGLEVCRRIRARAQTPILMLTARGRPEDVLAGFAAKPFEPRELLARLRAILRRAKGDDRKDVLRFGRLEIDTGARTVRLDGDDRTLTSHQFALLLALAQHAGRVLSRDVIMDLLKNERLEAFDRSIDVHISRIRAAIEDDAKKPRRIITVRGAGYVFAKLQS